MWALRRGGWGGLTDIWKQASACVWWDVGVPRLELWLAGVNGGVADVISQGIPQASQCSGGAAMATARVPASGRGSA